VSDPTNASTWIERIALGLIAVVGTCISAWAIWLKAKLDAATTRETKTLEVKIGREDNTESRFLEAWQVERKNVLEERAALAAERVASRREREDADAARRAYREELTRINDRLMVVEQAHSTCPGQIAALRAELERTTRESSARETRLELVERELELARFARDSERP
jgi:chromosome segregation ATPase